MQATITPSTSPSLNDLLNIGLQPQQTGRVQKLNKKAKKKKFFGIKFK